MVLVVLILSIKNPRRGFHILERTGVGGGRRGWGQEYLGVGRRNLGDVRGKGRARQDLRNP